MSVLKLWPVGCLSNMLVSLAESLFATRPLELFLCLKCAWECGGDSCGNVKGGGVQTK